MKKHVSKLVSMALAAAMVIGGMPTTAALAAWDDIDADRKYTAQFDNLQDLAEYEEQLNVQIGQESFVLLKNEGETLPLQAWEKNVTVLGTAADTPSTGGGSGALSQPYRNNPAVEGVSTRASLIYDALELAGINYNPRMRERYLTVNPVSIGGGGMGGGLYREGGHYMEEVEEGAEYDAEFGGRYFKAIKDGSMAGADDNFSVYGDAAIVFLSRSGSEGADNFAHSVQGHKDQTEHYSTLSDSEYELLAYAKYNFDKIIVVLNTPAVLEIGAIEDDPEIGAVVWVGQTGWNGIEGLGKMLTGEVDFSGRLVDFWMRDMKTDPTYYNFGNYSQALYAQTGEYTLSDGTNNIISNGSNTVLMLGDPANATYSNREHAIDYTEGIFMGYRYYETVAADLTAAGADGEAWYQDVTLYPFGYGLSYTTYEQEIVGVEGDINDPNGELTVTVKVTNTGNYAGKDVVQLYSTAPYFEGEIDKPEVALVQFEKTGMLKPGKSEEVKLTFAVKDLANFDYNDANANDYCGYELEPGDYKLSIRNNSHDELDAVTLTCETAGQWDEDGNPDTPNNIFSQDLDTEWGAFNTNAYFWTESEEDHYLHRYMLLDYYEDLTQLTWLATDDNYFKDEAFNVLFNRQYFNSYMDNDNKLTQEVETDYVNAWTKTKEDIPENWTQGAGVIDEATGMYPITLADMTGVAFDDPKWDEFLNQLTWEELTASEMQGGYKTIGVPSVGRYQVADPDGPAQHGGAWSFCADVNVASTWSKELAYKYGEACGNEAMLVTNNNGQINGWYAPASDLQRNPLAGRNFEYFSQDGVQGGYMSGYVCLGYTDMGGHVYLKHSFLNDQETNRSGGVTFVTEQALREIYAKIFEIGAKVGKANGFMNAFNLIGVSSSANFAVGHQLYIEEWGFMGYSVTDFYSNGANGTGWSAGVMARGNTMPLGNGTAPDPRTRTGYDGFFDAEKNMVMAYSYDANAQDLLSETEVEEAPTQWYWVRDNAKRMMFTQANLNGQKAGYYSYMLDVKTDLFKQNVEVNENLLTDASLEALAKVFGAVGYTVSANGLPKGITMAADGTVSGTPLENGEKAISVSIVGKNGLGYISDSKNFTLAVADFDEELNEGVVLDVVSATIGEEYAGQITASAVEFTAENSDENAKANADFVGKYNKKIRYSATGLPAGLTVDAATGAITGTPEEVGTFCAIVTAGYEKINQTAGSSGRVNYNVGVENFSSVYRFVVDGAFNVSFDAKDGSDAQKIGVAGEVTFADIKDKVVAPASVLREFLGWATSANATAADVTDETAITEATTFYAVYGPDMLSVGANGNLFVYGVDTGIAAK